MNTDNKKSLKQQLKSKQKKLMGIQMTHSIYRKDKRNLSVKDRDWLHLQFIKLVEKRGWVCGGGAGFTDLNNVKDDYCVTVTPKHTIEKI